MTEAGWAALQRRLLTRYADFKRRLTRYLGSADLAADALHDTWLRLERGGQLATVHNPDSYVYSMAVNIAANRRRDDNRRLTSAEVDALLNVADDVPDAARALEARAELEAVIAIIGELPLRQQAILLAARLDNMPRRDLAARFGVSERFVQRELQQAHDYCAARLEKFRSARFSSPQRQVSIVRKPVGPAAPGPRRSATDGT
jgi:RNA polymerase sigma-70 factor (ECF subfamily)